jgi:hypothetical protein
MYLTHINDNFMFYLFWDLTNAIIGEIISVLRVIVLEDSLTERNFMIAV